MNDIINKRLEEFEKKFVANDGERFLRGSFWDEDDAVKQIKQFLSTAIQKSIEEAFEVVRVEKTGVKRITRVFISREKAEGYNQAISDHKKKERKFLG